MRVEIWSDVVCPFCYIGKRRFEQALLEFPQRDQVEIVWKSFQLMPDFVPTPGQSLDEMLAAEKGITLERAKAMNRHASSLAQQAGLQYNMEKVVPANTLRAHSLVHFAKDSDRHSEVVEALFRSYFTEGKDIDDPETLVRIAQEAGLDDVEARAALESERFVEQVQSDIREAQELGVRGVPFFVFDRKSAISGAQDPELFLQALKESYS